MLCAAISILFFLVVIGILGARQKEYRGKIKSLFGCSVFFMVPMFLNALFVWIYVRFAFFELGSLGGDYLFFAYWIILLVMDLYVFFSMGEQKLRELVYFILFLCSVSAVVLLLFPGAGKQFALLSLRSVGIVESPSDVKPYFFDGKKYSLMSMDRSVCDRLSIFTCKSLPLSSEVVLHGYMAWNMGNQVLFCPRNASLKDVSTFKNCLLLDRMLLQEVHIP